MGLSYPFSLSFSKVGEWDDFPWIRPSDFIKTLGLTGDLHRILGGHRNLREAAPLLQEFWKRWRVVQPLHSIFKLNLPLQQCVPLYVHEDEGVTYKKQGVLILSLQAPFGRGGNHATKLEQNQVLPHKLLGLGIPLNFIDTGLQSRLLSVVAPKDRVSLPTSCLGKRWIPQSTFCF